MRSSLLAALLVVATGVVAVAAVTYEPLSNQAIEAQFKADGFSPIRWVQYNDKRGLLVESVNATTRSNGLHKPVYYVEGNGYEQGFLMGLMAENATARMATTYLKHVVPQLVDAALDRLLWNSTVYEEFLIVLDAYMIEGTVRAFEEEADAGVFSEELVMEMHGLVDGCAAANPQTPVTWQRVVTLNFGFDFVLAAVYAGKLWPLLNEYAHGSPSVEVSDELLAFLDEHEPNGHLLLKAPVIFCDAFGVSGNATASGEDAYFARDFQLATADTFQELAALVISVPDDGRIPLVSAIAPGFIGSLVAFNAQGVAMGVDVARGAAVNASWVGLNSILLVRSVVDRAVNRAAALDIIQYAQRGVTYLYPLCDGAGRCAVVEASKSTPGVNQMNPLQYANFPGLNDLLPSQSFIDSHMSTPFLNGIFVRTDDYIYPNDYLSFNQAMFEHVHYPYNASAWGPTGFVYDDWKIEKPATLVLGANFFPTQRETFPDVVIVSNTALVPDMRMNQMSLLPYLLLQGSNGLHWRYDSMNEMITESYGKIDWAKAKEIITFLAPNRSVGYWQNPPLDPKDPMTQEVEGVIALANLKTGYFELKAGYWCDEWISVHLNSYFTTIN